MKPLDQLAVGKVARIESLAGPPDVVQRLCELGILEGEPVEVIAIAPLGGPLEIRCGETRLSVRRREAAFVLIAE